MTQKRCADCKRYKDVSYFGKQTNQEDGLHYYCKSCRYLHTRGLRSSPKRKSAESGATEKCCTKCKQTKPISDFPKDVSRKDGLQAKCRICCSLAGKKHYQEHSEELSGKHKNWRDTHKEETRIYHKRLRDSDPAAYRDYRKARYWGRPDVIARNLEKGEKLAEKEKKKRELIEYKNDPQREIEKRAVKIAGNRLRKARQRGAEGKFSPKDTRKLFSLQAGFCAYCSTPLPVPGYHIEHITPVINGGSNWPTNLCLACPRCNSQKKDMPLELFCEIKGFDYQEIIDRLEWLHSHFKEE